MKKIIMIVLLTVAFLMVFTTDISAGYDPDELIRFHVLANSDSEVDQALKHKVKDQVVQYMTGQFSHSESIEESRQILLANMDQIKAIASSTIRAEGSQEAVDVQYGRFDFPIKYYGNFSLPAGNYEAVRVVIGDGQGENWWCVLFPPMCFVDGGEAGLNKYTQREPKKEIKIRWRIGEWIAKITDGDGKTQERTLANS